MALRTLPQELGRTVSASPADVRIEIEDGLARELDVTSNQPTVEPERRQRLPDLLVNDQAVRMVGQGLEKPVERGPLLAAIRAALARDTAQAATADRLADLRARFASLTPREREVLDGVVCGKLNKQIAHDIGVAERTVKTHRAQVMAKMGADSPAMLGRIVEQLGPLPPPAR